MSKRKLVIFGGGELGEVSDYYFTHDSDYEISAFCLNQDYIKEDSFCGKPVVSFEDIEETHPTSEYEFFAALSYAKLNAVRKEKYLEAKKKGYKIATYVSSKAITWPDLTVGENCFILEHNNIQPFAKIGNNVTLWCSNHIGHHAIIGDHNFLASHIVVSGGVNFGESSFVGVNATFRDHITIGNNCLIGAAASVMKNMPDNTICTPQSSTVKPLNERIVNSL